MTGVQTCALPICWDGKRLYITSSVLANWDKKGDDNEQMVRAFNWDGKDLAMAFEVDFNKEKLGRAHHMKFGTKSLRTAFDEVDGEKVAVISDSRTPK